MQLFTLLSEVMLNVVMFIVVMPNVVASMEAVRLQGQKFNLFRKNVLSSLQNLNALHFCAKGGWGAVLQSFLQP